MPRATKPDLLTMILEGIYDGGWNAIILEREHPFVLRVHRDNEEHQIRVYVWNLTHGGGKKRPADEYRIQITGLPDANTFNVQGVDKVAILGWWKPQNVFAAFDYKYHIGELGSSPSFQIREEALRNAIINGFATQSKGTGEIAVAFQPIFLPEYIRNLEPLHEFGTSKSDLELLEQAVEDPDQVNAQKLAAAAEERQTVITRVTMKLRSDSFRARIMAAYSQKCAFCELQLKLVDAAHIVPVSEAGTDATENGIALCALHHRAFDRALVTLNEKYQILLNQRKLDEFAAISLDEGSDWFGDRLRDVILVPPDKHDRPNTNCIHAANKLRGWVD